MAMAIAPTPAPATLIAPVQGDHVSPSAVTSAAAAAPTSSLPAALTASVVQSHLKRGIAIAAQAITTRGTSVPVFSNILLTATDGRLRLRGTNTLFSISTTVAATVAQAGETTLPSKLLTDFVSKLPDEPVSLALDLATHTVKLTSMRSVGQIKGIPAVEFPTFPDLDAVTPTTTLPSKVLRQALEQVVFAAANPEDTRVALTAVLMRITGKTITLFAADGVRFAIKTITLEQEVSTPVELLLPAIAMSKLVKILSSDDTPVAIIVATSGNRVLFRTDQAEFYSAVIEGKAVPFERLIPKATKSTITVKREALLLATEQAGLFAESHATEYVIERGGETGDRVTLTANASDIGAGASQVEGQVVGQAGKLVMNNTYVGEALKAIDAERVVLEYESEMPAPNVPQAGFFRPFGDDTLLIVVMPMAVK